MCAGRHVCSIHWVTSPQLALLEDAMRKMERVDAWIMMNGGGHGADVFTVRPLPYSCPLAPNPISAWTPGS